MNPARAAAGRVEQDRKSSITAAESTRNSRTPRALLSFSRNLEFINQPELAKRMGIPLEGWLRATTKELIDNGLDAVEEAGVDPAITVTVDGRRLTVADNGPGMAPELVERLCKLTERTSTREPFAAPDRGAQGNALQTIMHLGFGYGHETSRLTIDSQGINHQIALRANRLAGRVELERMATPTPAGDGTSVTVPWPIEVDPTTLSNDARRIVYEQAWLNPHAEFHLIIDSETAWTADPTTAVRKWTPGMAVPPHWYSPERFEHRVLLEIKRDSKLTVAQFLGTFWGLKSTVKRAEVAAAAGLSYQPLAALLDSSGTRVDSMRAMRLLAAMCSAGRAPKPDVLGRIGRETFEEWAGNLDHGEPQFLTYDTFDTVVYGHIPIRWEIGFCHLPDTPNRQLLAGQNFSPALLPERMADIVMRDCAFGFGSAERIGLLLHRITPARHTVDFGKTIPAIYQTEFAVVGGR
jgi:DNA topoisomerase VI subunit B